MGHAVNWSSAIAAEPPPVPRLRHWVAGLAASAVLLAASAVLLTEKRVQVMPEAPEAVVVALGGPARRLEAPPEGVETTDQPDVPAERAADAPPPAPPEQPRRVAAYAAGQGGASSGTGGTRSVPSPPPPPRPPAPPPSPPPPPPPPALDRQFVLDSQQQLMQRIVYPPASLRHEEQGMGVLRVQIDRGGRLLSWQVVRSTGYPRLDDEIRRVAAETRHLDPLPAGYPQDTATADIQIYFVIEYVDEE